MRRLPAILALALALAAGCAHERAAAPSTTEQPDAGQAAPATAAPSGDGGVASDQTLLPPGCGASLAGEWRHEDSPSYLYRATDDGSTATLVPYRQLDDAPPSQTPPGASIVLRRGPDGFSGQLRMTEDVGGGKECPVAFDAHVAACGKDRLTLRIEQSYAVDANCKRVDTGGTDIAEHVLVRAPPQSPAEPAAAPAKAR